MPTIEGRWRFADEARNIGCGERGVIIQIGRKWVYITEKSTGSKVKLPLEVFKELKERRLVPLP